MTEHKVAELRAVVTCLPMGEALVRGRFWLLRCECGFTHYYSSKNEALIWHADHVDGGAS